MKTAQGRAIAFRRRARADVRLRGSVFLSIYSQSAEHRREPVASAILREHDGAEEDGPIGFEEERREEAGQKENGGVQVRHHAKAWRRLPHQIAWQPLPARA